MPNYKLPSNSTQRYRGKYPARFRSISTGYDCDGQRAWHVETNLGERFTLNYACLTEAARRNGLKLSNTVADVIEPGFPVITMTHDVYMDWLARIQSARKED